MADVSKIKLGETTYNIKDSSAIRGTVTTGDSVTVGTAFTVPNVTNAGSAATAAVSGCVLTITNGTAPTLGTAFTIPNISKKTVVTSIS